MTIREAADEIKRTVRMEQVLALYGYETDRAGFMRCPFHSGDHTASLKVYRGSRGWSCFGCHAGGTCIDFVMKADGVPFADAVRNIDTQLWLRLLEVPVQRSLASFIGQMNRRRAAEQAQSALRSAWRDVYGMLCMEDAVHNDRSRRILQKTKQERTGSEDAWLLNHRNDGNELSMEIKYAKERSEHLVISGRPGGKRAEGDGEEPADHGCDGGAVVKIPGRIPDE